MSCGVTPYFLARLVTVSSLTTVCLMCCWAEALHCKNPKIRIKKNILFISLSFVVLTLQKLFPKLYCSCQEYYSHSIVAGGLELMSYTTLFTPFTLLMISFEIFIRNSYGRCTQSAVIPSVDSTALRATTFSYVRSSPITPTLFTGSKIAPACQTLS